MSVHNTSVGVGGKWPVGGQQGEPGTTAQNNKQYIDKVLSQTPVHNIGQQGEPGTAVLSDRQSKM